MQIERPPIDIGLRQAAKSQRLDLNAPKNAYTLWAVDPAWQGALLCGNSADMNSLYALARKHTELKNLSILPADPTKYAVTIKDSDRERALYRRE